MRSALLLAALACACHRDPTKGLPWTDASAWAGTNEAARAWEWILASEAVPSPPPAVAWLGIDGFDHPAATGAAAHARGDKEGS